MSRSFCAGLASAAGMSVPRDGTPFSACDGTAVGLCGPSVRWSVCRSVRTPVSVGLSVCRSVQNPWRARLSDAVLAGPSVCRFRRSVRTRRLPASCSLGPCGSSVHRFRLVRAGPCVSRFVVLSVRAESRAGPTVSRCRTLTTEAVAFPAHVRGVRVRPACRRVGRRRWPDTPGTAATRTRTRQSAVAEMAAIAGCRVVTVGGKWPRTVVVLARQGVVGCVTCDFFVLMRRKSMKLSDELCFHFFCH